MWGMGFQPGVSGAASKVSSAPKFSDSAQELNGGLPARCCCSAFILPTSRRQAGTRGGNEREGRLLLCVRNPAYHMPPPLLSRASVPLKRRNRQGPLTCMAALGFEVTPAAVIVLSTVVGFAGLRTYIYFRMEISKLEDFYTEDTETTYHMDFIVELLTSTYIIAAMLGRHVPRGGAKIVELNTRGGKNLYYYPADVAQVVAVSSIPNVQLLENQATRAGVPIQVKTKGPTALGVPSSSMDAVVSVFCLRDVPDNEVLNVLREAVRVLEPGKPFIFVEPVRAKSDFLGGLFNLVGTKRATIQDLQPYLTDLNFEEVDCEEVLTLVDPHLVGVAKKKLSVVSEPNKDVRKGFKKNSKARQG